MLEAAELQAGEGQSHGSVVEGDDQGGGTERTGFSLLANNMRWQREGDRHQNTPEIGPNMANVSGDLKKKKKK